MTEQTDYRELLKKYIAHVMDQEGIDFILESRAKWSGKLSKQDQVELEVLAKEVADASAS